MEIRTATPADLEAMLAVHTAARTAYYRAGGLRETEVTDPQEQAERAAGWARAIVGDHRTTMCAVRAEGTVVGVLSAGIPADGELYQIHVAPGDWGTGVGTSLHAAYVQALRAAGLRHGTLYAWERNARAGAFYARHGWRPDGRRRPGPGGADYIGLRLELSELPELREPRDAAQASSSSSAPGRAMS
jgi:RimJ/RimL family protein N-acetyltransferase